MKEKKENTLGKKGYEYAIYTISQTAKIHKKVSDLISKQASAKENEVLFFTLRWATTKIYQSIGKV